MHWSGLPPQSSKLHLAFLRSFTSAHRRLACFPIWHQQDICPDVSRHCGRCCSTCQTTAEHWSHSRCLASMPWFVQRLWCAVHCGCMTVCLLPSAAGGTTGQLLLIRDWQELLLSILPCLAFRSITAYRFHQSSKTAATAVYVRCYTDATGAYDQAIVKMRHLTGLALQPPGSLPSLRQT